MFRYSRSSVTTNFFEALSVVEHETEAVVENSKVALLTRVVMPEGLDQTSPTTTSVTSSKTATQVVLPDYFMFSIEHEDSETTGNNTGGGDGIKIVAIPIQLNKSVYFDLISNHQDQKLVKSENSKYQQESSHFLLPANYKSGQPIASTMSTKTMLIKQESQSPFNIPQDDPILKPKKKLQQQQQQQQHKYNVWPW